MAVKREEELQRILEEDLDGRVEKRDGEEAAVRAVADSQDVVGHLERPDVDKAQLFRPMLRISMLQRCSTRATHHSLYAESADHLLSVHLDHLKVPEFDILVCASADKTPAVRSDVQAPHRTIMRLVRRQLI